LLLIDPAELGGGDVVAVDRRDHGIARGSGGIVQKAGDVKEHKRYDDNRQAPLEPAFVPSHPVEHCHGSGILFRRKRAIMPYLSHAIFA
jgi:hypothetical protein